MAFSVADGHPATEWLAEYNRRSEYNEAEILGLIKEIIDLLILFGYVEADQIDWPPENGHPINETLCNEYRLERPVISLMQKLPYVKRAFHGDLSFNIFPASPQVRYLDDDLFRWGREAEMHMHGVNVIEVQDVALTVCMLYGTSIILDTRENVIRLISPQAPQEHHYPLERPEFKRHYRNAVASHAPSFLQCHINRIRSLSVIPYDTGNETVDFCDKNIHEELVSPSSIPFTALRVDYSIDTKLANFIPAEKNPRIQEILRNSFGYPDNFRRAEWIAEKESIWERTMNEVFEEFGEY